MSKFEVEGNQKSLKIKQTKEGNGYGIHDYKIVPHGLPFKVGKVLVDGEEIDADKSFHIPRSFETLEILK